MQNKSGRATVHTAVLLLLLLTGVSCAKDRMTGMNGANGVVDETIDFGISALWLQTRALATDYDGLESVGVYGYYTETERWEWSAKNNAAALTANYFTNLELKKSELWTYSPLKYWPADTRKKISFFAYSPYVANADVDGAPIDLSGEPLEPYPATDLQTGAPTLRYTVPADIKEQKDLMYAALWDMDRSMAPVDFTMKHTLTALSFTAKMIKPEDLGNYGIDVTNITLSGVYETGVLDMATGEWAFDESADPEGAFVIDGTNLRGETLGGDLTVHSLLPDAAGVLMLIPQDLSKAYLSFELVFTPTGGTPSSTPASFSLADLNEHWEAGKAINYELQLSGEFISVHTSQILWQPGNTSTGDVEP